jgi:hypothetical protein
MESADWSQPGVIFYGGAHDGRHSPAFPKRLPLINLAKTVAGVELVELYERTEEAFKGHTIYRWVYDQPAKD